NDGQLFDFFREIAGVPGGVALVHCENHALVEAAERPLREAGRQDLPAWSERSMIFGELESIRRALTLAQAAGVRKMGVVHLGIGSGSEVVQQKVWGSVQLAVETCPHYLVFDKDQALGVAGKVGPPLRDRAQVNAVWEGLTNGTFDFIGSDQL